MDSQDKPQNEERIPPKTLPLADKPDSVNALPPQPDTATELQKLEQQATNLEKQTTAFEKSSLRWIKISVLMSFLTFIFISLQWYEMHTGSIDTAKLAQAATDQATRTVPLITQAKNQADNTHALAVAADTQSKQAIEQTKKMTESLTKTDNLIKATADLARQAKRSADLAQQALRLEQRPWITSTAFRLTGEPEQDKEFTATMFIANTGKTPAINVTVKTGFFSWIGEPPEIGDISPPVLSRAVVAPNPATSFKITIAPAMKLNAVQFAGYQDGRNNIYIRARIEYFDLFNQPHWTGICVFRKHGEPLDEWQYCEHGNDTDHEK